MTPEIKAKYTLVNGHRDQLQTTHWQGIKQFEELFQATKHELEAARATLLVNFGPNDLRSTSVFPHLINPGDTVEKMILTVFEHLLTTNYNITQ